MNDIENQNIKDFELEIPKKQFQDHLEIPNNQRIIFSGAFGTGKTYFLDKFFKNHEKYEAIHIYPVNYSVSSNEDIFELIKYDVLFKLLKKGLNFDEVKIDKGTFLPFFLENHSNELIPHLLSIIPKVGGSLEKLAKGLLSLNEKFQKEFRQVNETDKDKVLSYLKRFTAHQGSIHEEDFFSQLICGLVEQLKKLEPLESEADKNPKKETEKKEAVLIIDDLDRIDPEHIFRIMNVLAAHVDIKKDSDQNKFDFNKIILVCDIENIRKIFSNRYGADVDFSGYIDKFYSRSIFHYDLSGEMIKSINQVFGSVILDSGKGSMSLDDLSKDVAGAFIKQVLYSFIQHNLVSIRVLKRIFSGKHRLNEREVWAKGKNDSITNSQIEIIKVLDFLTYLFQDTNLLAEKCKVLIGKEISLLDHLNHTSLIIEIIKGADYKNYRLNIRKLQESKQEDFKVNLDQKTFKYAIDSSFNSSGSDIYPFRIKSVIEKSGVEVKIEDVDFFGLLAVLIEETDIKNVLNNNFEVI